VLTSLKNIGRALDSDRLNTMIKESSGIRDKNLDSMIKAGEEKSEIYLERHIKEQLKGRHKKLGEKLADDDLIEWVIMGAMVLVAIFGFFMWRKLKEQKSVLL
jgi:hypothetical protein